MRDDSCVYLGCDTGEAAAGPGREREVALLPYMSAVSIACGGHAGDESSVRELMTEASRHGCILGAHPSYPDKEGFGRRALEIDRSTLASSLQDQLRMFVEVAAGCNQQVSFVKAHGALYHKIASDTEFAHWYWELCTSVVPHARFVGPAGSRTLHEFRQSGVSVFTEGFCDRVYEEDGTLRSRNLDGAFINEPAIAAEQAEVLMKSFDCDLLCIHSDTENAIEIAREVHRLLCPLDNERRRSES
ncbi:MAG: LamB/YcsF family protein [Phycisphaerales bacterium]|nr:LamB/YcsF family protein [Phycisphaerales bacterium]